MHYLSISFAVFSLPLYSDFGGFVSLVSRVISKVRLKIFRMNEPPQNLTRLQLPSLVRWRPPRTKDIDFNSVRCVLKKQNGRGEDEDWN